MATRWLGIVAALALGGCGGSDGGDAMGGKASREALIERGDAICRDIADQADRRNERVNAVAKAAPNDDVALTNLEPVLRDGLEEQRAANRRFAALEPPSDDREEFRNVVGRLQEQTALLARAVDAAVRKDADAFQAIGKEQGRLRPRVRTVMQDFGFKDCGSGSTRAE